MGLGAQIRFKLKGALKQSPRLGLPFPHRFLFHLGKGPFLSIQGHGRALAWTLGMSAQMGLHQPHSHPVLYLPTSPSFP